jgi:hypothetical protein
MVPVERAAETCNLPTVKLMTTMQTIQSVEQLLHREEESNKEAGTVSKGDNSQDNE